MKHRGSWLPRGIHGVVVCLIATVLCGTPTTAGDVARDGNLALIAGAVALEGRNRFLATVASAGPWLLVSVLASAVVGLGLEMIANAVGTPPWCWVRSRCRR